MRDLRSANLAALILACSASSALVQAARPDDHARDRDGPSTSSDGALSVTVKSMKVFAASGKPAAVAANWNLPGFDDRMAEGWIAASGPVLPLPSSWRAGDPSPASFTGATAIPIGGGPLYFRMRFDVADVTAARSIELSVIYRDGFVAYLNGVEVARRNLPVRTPSDAGEPKPRIPHGGDPEHIYLPVEGASWRLKAAENLLAVRVSPAITRGAMDSNAPAGQIAVAVHTRVRLVRGPYLLAPSDDAISVAWETDRPTRGTVFFEKVFEKAASELGHPHAPGGHSRGNVKAPALQTRQVVRISGLEPGQRYRYRVEVEAMAAERITSSSHRASLFVSSPDAEFEAAPAKKATARFIVYGDMRAPGHAAHAAIVAAIVRERPALVLNSGDLVATGSEESAWQRYFEITAPMGAMSAVVPALGNHEAYLRGAAKSWTLFGMPSASPVPGTGYTSLDWGGLHFVILDTNNIDAAELDWLVRDLAAARRSRARAIIALCHDGPWSHGIHGGSLEMEREVVPRLVAGGVDVLFAGHDHLYERGVGVVGGRPRLPYVISGGGGAPLYNPSCIPIAQSGARRGGGGGGGPGETGWPEGLPMCPAYVAAIKKAHHYVAVEVDDAHLRICPRAPDGVALEPCTSIPLAANR